MKKKKSAVTIPSAAVRLSSQAFWVEYNNGARVKLRRPTNEELDDFFIALAEARGDGADIKAFYPKQQELRVCFYDALFLESENLVDEKGKAVTKETVSKIPGFWKTDIIFREFERLQFAIKNC